MFLIRIHNLTDGLRIEDRRPDLDLVVSWGGCVAAVALFFTVGVPMAGGGTYWPAVLIGAAVLYLAYRSATRYFRSVYGFDKARNTYVFFRQALLRKEVVEGTLEEFSAVQIEHAVVRGDNTSHDIYRVGLILDGGLTLGRSPSQYLRSKPPLFSNYAPEERIAKAIAAFLNIRNDGQVDVASFGSTAIGF